MFMKDLEHVQDRFAKRRKRYEEVKHCSDHKGLALHCWYAQRECSLNECHHPNLYCSPPISLSLNIAVTFNFTPTIAITSPVFPPATNNLRDNAPQPLNLASRYLCKLSRTKIKRIYRTKIKKIYIFLIFREQRLKEKQRFKRYKIKNQIIVPRGIFANSHTRPSLRQRYTTTKIETNSSIDQTMRLMNGVKQRTQQPFWHNRVSL